MSLSPVGDTIAVVKLAYSLYSRVVVVARDAPEQFQELSRDLQSIKDVLYLVRGEVHRDRDLTYSTPVEDILFNCLQTLRGLRDLTAKYENLTWSDRSVFTKRFKFASEQGAIDKFREKLKEQQGRLQLALTVEGRQAILDACKAVEFRLTLSLRNQLIEIAQRESSALKDIRKLPVIINSLSKETFQPLTLDTRSLSLSTSGSTYSEYERSLERPGPSGVDTETSLDSIPSYPTTSRREEELHIFIPPPDREKHNASPELQKAFHNSFESLRGDFDVTSWVQLATWWLVKSRTVRRLINQAGLQRRRTDASQYQLCWDKSISEEQAYTDLLKASWILEEIVLAEGNGEELSTTSARRLGKDLTTNLTKDFRERREADSNLPQFASAVLLKQDPLLLESFEQEVEAIENVPTAIDDPSPPYRWFNTDQDNAGFDRERVVFRTFVNAQLGKREDRSKSSSAPYMLLQWTIADESELLISVCNQRGTVNLSRKLLAEDLDKYKDADGTMPFQIDFPSQEAEIMFLSTQDVSEFLRQPKLYFGAMKEKTPKPGELAIYQAPISAYSDVPVLLSPTSCSSTRMASGKSSSCGLRIYESMPDKCWKVTRRLVVSSPPDSLEPDCVSHWLPLGHIRTLLDRARVTISWSDCGHLETIGDGNWGTHHSFVYKAEEPNKRIHLDFTNAAEAQKFRETLLLPTEVSPQVTTKLEICSDFQSVRIYRLFDADEPDIYAYHAIALAKKSPQGPHMSEIFFAYRDLDWVFMEKKGSPIVVEFSSLFVPHYTSTIPRLQAKPRPTDPLPDFSNVEQDEKKAHLEFECDDELFQFMHALTGWRPKFFRAIEKLVLIDTSLLIRSSKVTSKDVDIQLWEKASAEGRSRTHLAVRLPGQTKDRWITAALVDNNYTNRYNMIEIDRLAIQRGIGVDTKEMTAKRRASEDQSSAKRKWKLAITFKVPNDKCEFLKSSGLDSFM